MDHQVLRVLKALCRQVGTPRALTVKLLAEHGEWTQLQELRVRPSDYLYAESLKKDLAVTEFLRKCELPGDSDRKYEAAVATFWACEAQNKRTNDRLDPYLHNGPYFGAQEVRVASFIEKWRKKIAEVVGRLPVRLTPRFSGGATYSDSSRACTAPDKMQNRATYYKLSSDLLPFWWESAWGRCSFRNHPRVVKGNIFFTVPKDGTKDRGCCKEASIPVALQLEVGAFLKDRLLRQGISLREGQQTHQDLARSASESGEYATLDLSNASDTLCYKLVKLLLPPDWFTLLDSLRAPFTRVDGQWVHLEKFSSMGNGFTFELETLVFYTLVETLMEDRPYLGSWCYGDDLIVPSAYARDVIAALTFFGFTPNERKCFLEGHFRESCGGDFFKGEPVRAHYLEKLPDEPQQWISLANGLRRLGAWASHARSEALKQLPSEIRQCRGPEELGDIVIHDDPEHFVTHTITVKGRYHRTRVSAYRAYVPVPIRLHWHHWKPGVQLAGALLGLSSNGVSPRGVSGYKLGWVQPPGNGWLPVC